MEQIYPTPTMSAVFGGISYPILYQSAVVRLLKVQKMLMARGLSVLALYDS